ncbi:MAG: ABC transporter [Bacillota bacterium]|nr:ABC transporter [Bacillota bacterium]
MTAIYKKEVRSYFNNMTGYIFIAFILLIVGVYTTAYNFRGAMVNFEYVLGAVGFIFTIVVPILTMRAMSEERRQKTDQLLLTCPVTVTGVILGKYLAMVTILLIPSAFLCAYPLILSQFGTLSLAICYGSILAFFLMGCALIAVGLFISTLTENQIIAAVLSFAVLILAYMMSNITSLASSSALGSFLAFTALLLIFAAFLYVMTGNRYLSLTAAAALEVVLLAVYLLDSALFAGAFLKVMESLAFFTYLDRFVYNRIFDLTAIIYYLSLIFLFLFFSVQAVEKRRWS